MQLGSRLVDFTDREFTQEQFEDWVRALPETIYRMKGYVPIEGIKTQCCSNMLMEWFSGSQNI